MRQKGFLFCEQSLHSKDKRKHFIQNSTCAQRSELAKKLKQPNFKIWSKIFSGKITFLIGPKTFWSKVQRIFWKLFDVFETAKNVFLWKTIRNFDSATYWHI